MDIVGRNEGIVREGERMIWQKVVYSTFSSCNFVSRMLSLALPPPLPELSRSKGRVGEDPGNEVVSSRLSSARIKAGGNGSFYLAAEILNS